MAKRVNIMIQGLTSEPDLFVLEFAVNDVRISLCNIKCVVGTNCA